VLYPALRGSRDAEALAELCVQKAPLPGHKTTTFRLIWEQ
jgi:hypothetical protein